MAETVNVEKPTGVSVRAFSHGEESALLHLLADAFGSFADIPRTKAVLSSRRFDADGCFVAEDNGVPIGWVAATRLPRDNWFVIRYLSVKQAMIRTDVVESLLDRAINHVESKEPEFLRATTPAVQPYVEVYQKFAFKPLRRDFELAGK
jgi:predicted N-acetyltransferase YhbS